ncbi:protein export cytoplasm protein SecA ATPase RNA helicase [Anopheles sinensis]|uniref:Protein export cytoplasm protein SecA ATPase RNA helicase n=1 Tax=Anopheles sinensis TaxID=74873 RepID=A0A084VNA3_ANOSI|nr:protein export cytoplasm protein SecA ATPase RNA helicase [Anopheles sinensis]
MSSSSSHAILPFAALFAQDDDSEPGVVWFEGENAYFETLSDVMVPGHKCLHGVGLGQTVFQDVEFPITIPIVYEPSATSMLPPREACKDSIADGRVDRANDGSTVAYRGLCSDKPPLVKRNQAVSYEFCEESQMKDFFRRRSGGFLLPVQL